MAIDATLLSRQLAWMSGWYILLPAFTLGLASFVAVLEGFISLARTTQRRRRYYMDFHKLKPCGGSTRVGKRFASAEI
jgi:cytochrome bd-type quinol oxidase subunit 1